ncbi:MULTISPECIES: acyltransferase family protein [unclassified Blastococcus]
METTGARDIRYDWPDAGRGVCMVLVVLMHTSIWVDAQIGEGDRGLWAEVTEYLAPLRMPLFFVISGFFAARVLSRPLAQTRRRTVGMFYLYALWTALFQARLWVPGVGPESPPSAAGIVISILAPTAFWYLYALPLYFLIARVLVTALGPRSAWALIPLAAVSAVAPLLDPVTAPIQQDPLPVLMLPSLLANLVWFYLGTQAPALWLRLMRSATPSKLIAAVSGYSAAYWPLAALDVEPAIRLPLSALALYAAAQVLGLWSMGGPVARLMRAIGARTLPVYILHFFVISALSATVTASGALAQFQAAADLWILLLPAVLVGPIIGGTILAGRIVGASPLCWMLTPPTAVVGRQPATTIAS